MKQTSYEVGMVDGFWWVRLLIRGQIIVARPCADKVEAETRGRDWLIASAVAQTKPAT